MGIQQTLFISVFILCIYYDAYSITFHVVYTTHVKNIFN